ncbi:MAG: hypothetical protein HYZ37_10100 [Candidatus Solibacter usitatus]|nr:hypothetical protein [Candidatus Solibacter usitatus]
MPETLQKLRPDRDLQCYFEKPSAIAALSAASANGFTVSGCWRQSFDWAVVDWNRDNVIEHPLFRNLPDGDLSGLTLSYDEVRTNCMAMDSGIYPTVDWPYLRIWAGAAEQVYKVGLKDYATAIEGSYAHAYAEFTLGGSLTVGDYTGLAWLDEQYNHLVASGDTISSVAQAIVDAVNSLSPSMSASRAGNTIRLEYATAGAGGNLLGAYGFTSGAKSETWTPASQNFTGGASPSKWRITIPFANLHDLANEAIPTAAIRKMRWTYAADFHSGQFVRTEFSVVVTNWQVTGTNRAYRVAGKKSVRIEGNSPEFIWNGNWVAAAGNFSGGSIRYSSNAGDSCSTVYSCTDSHTLYLGSRLASNAAMVTIIVDNGAPQQHDLALAGEDVLVRIPIGTLAAGSHTVSITHSGTNGKYLYIDYLEAAVPSEDLPDTVAMDRFTAATDWDTDHSISIAPERTAWNLFTLGFRGRANHYAGALWFYELVRQGHQYAFGTITFSGTPIFSSLTTVTVGRVGQPGSETVFQHLNLIGETSDEITRALELRINNGTTGIRAQATGSVLTIYSRVMGADGNNFTIAATPTSGYFFATPSGPTLEGGVDGEWRTDLSATPRINRAVRDWTRSYCAALKLYNIDVTVAFSMELQHGDPSTTAGIAQRYPSGSPVLLNTPALQTNFSPTSISYWKQVYRDMAQVMVEAGVQPYLQFGEVQWWYFPYDGSGLPFHDTYTKDQFQAQFGFPIHAVSNGAVDPALFPEEASFLPAMIGEFTTQVMSFVRGTYANCKLEVLYPTDVNEGPFNRVINYTSSWNSATLDCLKTESFTYTISRNLDQCVASMAFSKTKGFANGGRSHLVGVGDTLSPWMKESFLASGQGLESVVLFALDQFCLMGYLLPLRGLSRKANRLG